MNISFSEQQEAYIANQLLSGEFKNATDVVRDALHLHEVYRTRLFEELRNEVNKGWDGPISKRNVEDIIAANTRR